MKKLNQILPGLIFLTVIATSCDSMLDVQSERNMFPENHQIDSPNDSIYSMMGIFTQLQKLGDRYVVLGELRGDLMDITENAGLELQEINNLEIGMDNPYNKIEDYYSVINHCNYLINNIDTALISGGEKSLLKEYAAAKAIRAWTYMQIALNYGTAKYYKEPLLTVQAGQAQFPEYSIRELVPVLIQELEPVKYVESPGRISLGVDMTSEKLFSLFLFYLETSTCGTDNTKMQFRNIIH
ncbi:MAG: RagB/SusD family nutrient uptake outer membrane protein [Draconibacterium sp.]|nr:RagB/SusD family nutrient uptake outer membrane protein [Draconibacterium sp.]